MLSLITMLDYILAGIVAHVVEVLHDFLQSLQEYAGL
jgi:hypothetical protein